MIMATPKRMPGFCAAVADVAERGEPGNLPFVIGRQTGNLEKVGRALQRIALKEGRAGHRRNDLALQEVRADTRPGIEHAADGIAG